jgi:hypothetical protein
MVALEEFFSSFNELSWKEERQIFAFYCSIFITFHYPTLSTIYSEAHRSRIRSLEPDGIFSSEDQNPAFTKDKLRFWALINLETDPNVLTGFENDFVLNIGWCEVHARVERIGLLSLSGCRRRSRRRCCRLRRRWNG